MNLKQAKELVRGRLSDKRYEHTINVKKMAVKLAKRYGADEEKAALAAILHDSAKEISKDEMREIMRQYPQYAEGGEQVHIILFYGDLGSGKTTFTRGFIEALPGGENAEVSSPSFTLRNSYPTTPSVIHCDLYRSEGALPDEVDEALDTESGLVLVEWAERIAAENLPPKRLDILFQVCKNNRLVTLSPYGKAAHCVLQKLARLRDSGE